MCALHLVLCRLFLCFAGQLREHPQIEDTVLADGGEFGASQGAELEEPDFVLMLS